MSTTRPNQTKPVSAKPDTSKKPDTFEQTFRAEVDRLIAPEVLAAGNPQERVDALDQPLTALCLSGGGIRSASFALGALQALAKYGALGEFHYLSTVSGGGYIGSWLTAWRHHARKAGHGDQLVFDALNVLPGTGIEAPEIAGIRADSNYLTPRLGMFSVDTWAAMTLVVRNLVMNWLIYLPLFMALLLAPQVAAHWVVWVHGWGPTGAAALAALGGAIAMLAACTTTIGRFTRKGEVLNTRRFVLLALIPLVLASGCFALSASIGVEPFPPILWSAGLAAGYGLAWLVGVSFSWGLARVGRGTYWLIDLIAWIGAGGIVGFLLSLGVRQAPLLSPQLLVAVGVQWCLLCVIIGELVYIAVTSFAPDSDMDREWLARAGGILAGTATSWSLLTVVALYGPGLLHAATQRLLALGFTTISGIATAVLGSSAGTAALPGQTRTRGINANFLTSLAALVLAVSLALLLAWIDGLLVTWLNLRSWMEWCAGQQAVAAGMGLGCIGIVASLFIDVNRFSMHAIYRNRLVRAFLGSARATQRDLSSAPGGKADEGYDPFTGFNERDNLKMHALDSSAPGRLLHVVNVTLNTVGTKKLAWQERKAEPFTITPLACGNPIVGYRSAKDFGDGVTLGTAMAVSGAAVSPNMGYHSSPLVGFLLMLFNLRLGWWFGNPSGRGYIARGPKLSIVPELQELAGATTDSRRWVYLSDGGHFENLGIYEMVRRRCRIIVVSDAGADPSYGFEDLGNAVRKIFIDQGVGIEFKHFMIAPPGDADTSRVYCATGTITYPGSEKPGWLLYVKPSYMGNERMDVRSYATAHPQFPNESTLNQWFSESQLEAYRALGAHVFELICGGGGEQAGPIHDLATLRLRVEAYLRSAGALPIDEHELSP